MLKVHDNCQLQNKCKLQNLAHCMHPVNEWMSIMLKYLYVYFSYLLIPGLNSALSTAKVI